MLRFQRTLAPAGSMTCSTRATWRGVTLMPMSASLPAAEEKNTRGGGGESGEERWGIREWYAALIWGKIRAAGCQGAHLA